MPESQLSEMAVYSPRPTVRVESQEQEAVTDLIISMEVNEVEGGMSSLELRVSNLQSERGGAASLAFEDDRVLKLGATITIYCGDENAPREVFRGKITALEADFAEGKPPELVVLAEDVFQQARMTRRTKLHENLTLSGLASDLASQLSLSPVVTGF